MFTKILFFCTLSVLFISNGPSSLAQTSSVPFEDKQNSLKVSPTAFFASTFALSYERYILNNMSLQITCGITAREKDSYVGSSNGTYARMNYKDKVTGGFGEAHLRFYLIKGRYRLRGLYGGIYGRYSNVKVNVNYLDYYYGSTSALTNVNYSITSYEGGVVAGYQFIFSNIVVLDLYVGGGIKISDSTKPNLYQSYNNAFPLIESQNYTGVTPKGGVRIGFVF